MPIKAQNKNHLSVGFVHKAYPTVLAWLANQAGFDTALVMRGIEGGILPTLRESSKNYRVHGEQVEDLIIDPKAFGIEQTTRGLLPKQSESVTAEETLDEGLKALSGQTGTAFDSLVLSAGINLWHVGLHTSQAEAADHVRKVLSNGRANAFFEAGIQS
jgi:anthranilate phosphoribosyltransferase